MILTFYDTETSGLDTTSSDIHQFAYMRWDTNQGVIGANSFFLWEDNYDWSEGAYKVNGLSKEFLRANGAPDIQKKYQEMFTVMSRAFEVGYNNNHFDRPMVDHFLARHSVTPEPQQSSIDVMQVAKQAFGKRFKLVDLCARLDITPEMIEAVTKYSFNRAGTCAHDAAYDTTATYICFLKLKEAGYVQI